MTLVVPQPDQFTFKAFGNPAGQSQPNVAAGYHGYPVLEEKAKCESPLRMATSTTTST